MAAQSKTDPPFAASDDLEIFRRHAAAAAGLMKALASENRLMILCVLAEQEMSVGELNKKIPLSQSGLSQQLALLRREGFVSSRREAQAIYYSLAPSNAARIIAVLREMYC